MIDGDFGNAGGPGDAGSLNFDLTGSVQTAGVGSHGMLLQSIGDVSGDIDIKQAGNVITQGDGSIGIIAQTISGSGGFIGGAFTGDAGGGAAGSIALDLTGSVQTAGAGSHGMVLQTIGTTAGDVGYHAGRQRPDRRATTQSASSPRRLAVRAAMPTAPLSAKPARGTAGSIAFDLTGSVQTAGDGSNGVLLQSIGGGDAGDIGYTQSGDILTGGDDAIGIIVQTLGGGGGFADNAIGNADGTRHRRIDRVRSYRLDLYRRRRLTRRAAAEHWQRRPAISATSRPAT